MAKAGMRRPEHHDGPKNEQTPVPEIHGKAKTGNAKAGPINAPNWAKSNYKSSHVDKD